MTRHKADAALGQVFDQENPLPYQDDLVAVDELPHDGIAKESQWQDWCVSAAVNGPGELPPFSWSRGLGFLVLLAVGVVLTSLGGWPTNGLTLLGLVTCGVGAAGVLRELAR